MKDITPAVKWMVIISTTVFFVTKFLGAYIHQDLVLTLSLHPFGGLEFRPWQVLTYPFVHQGLFSLFIDMYVLTSFGSFAEQLVGTRRFLLFMIATSWAAALAYILVTVGAVDGQADVLYDSGSSIFALLLFLPFFCPEQKVRLIIFPVLIAPFWPIVFYAVVCAVLALAYSVFSVYGNLAALVAGSVILLHWRRSGI